MASRKDQKEAARQARLAEEQAAAAKAAQTRRLGIIGGVVAIAVIIVVVAIVVSSGGGKSPKNTSNGLAKTKSASAGISDAVDTALKGIPQSGATLGKASAPVTIEYFGDLECPVCRDFSLGLGGGGLPQLISGPVKQGKVKLTYVSMETASGGTNPTRFVPQQVAAYAAGKQNLAWQYIELFYHEQGDETTKYVTENYLEGLAKQIPGLNFSKWMSDRNDAALKSQVASDGKLAVSYALQGTPSLVAVGPKGKEIVPGNIPTISDINSAVKAVS